jgi:AraC-like DNA-binding protein
MKRFVFSSDQLPSNLPVRERAGRWVDSMRAIGAAFDFDISQSDQFNARTEVVVLGRLHVGRTSTDTDKSVRVYRPNRLIAKDDDDRVLLMINGGDVPTASRQLGREVVLGRGEMTVFAMGSRCEVFTPAGGKTIGVLLPRALIAGGSTAIEDLAARKLDGDPEVRRLLVHHVGSLLGGSQELDPRAVALAADYLAGLVAMLVDGSRETRARAELHALPAARLAAVHDTIRRRFREPGLTAAIVGAELGLSARYVQHLLHLNGETFGGELSAIRLYAVHAELVDPQSVNVSIADIAFRCGFGDLSTFHRAFRARFGDTPGAVRLAAASGAIARPRRP